MYNSEYREIGNCKYRVESHVTTKMILQFPKKKQIDLKQLEELERNAKQLDYQDYIANSRLITMAEVVADIRANVLCGNEDTFRMDQ